MDKVGAENVACHMTDGSRGLRCQCVPVLKWTCNLFNLQNMKLTSEMVHCEDLKNGILVCHNFLQ